MPKLFNLLSSDVEEYVLQYIDEHHLEAGDRLPTERALAEELGITRSSLRSGLQALVDQGVIFSKQGSGSYLCQPKAIRTLATYCFPHADKAFANACYTARALQDLPVDLRWLTDHLSLGIESDVAKTDLFLESINNNIVSLTANVLSTHACMLYSDLFKSTHVPRELTQTQKVRIFDRPSESISHLLKTHASDTLLVLQNKIYLGERKIALSYSICVGTRVSLVSTTALPE